MARAAEIEKQQREERKAQQPLPTAAKYEVTRTINDEPTGPVARREPLTSTPSHERSTAGLNGDFGAITPVRLFTRLATQRETGQLVLTRGTVTKEIYLVDGAPEFIASNRPSERFGEYLVEQGVISPGELSMALAILPRFRGKLGDTLVGLNLLRPLEVFRYLTRQVREKMIDVFAWTDGTFHYTQGTMNARESFPLGLDAFEIIGAGVAGLSLDAVKRTLDRIGETRPVRREGARPSPEHFRVGAGPRELWQRLDGKRTVGEWMHRYDQPEQLLTLCLTLFLLIEAELVTLS
jgi:hypothetical protein